MAFYLDFEEPLRQLDARREELKTQGVSEGADFEAVEKEIARISKANDKKLTNFQRVQLARHQNRPHTIDFIEALCSDFDEHHGDRQFGDDPAILAGTAMFAGRSIVIVGHESGRDDHVARNFGMPRPEGLRKARRMMKLAERFGLPVVTFIDTAGAYPGTEGEDRNQNEAIAENLAVMSRLSTPIICCVIGQGGSGGALALGVGDHVIMLSNAVYSVASPEACAAILYRDGTKGELTAKSMRLSAKELFKVGAVDSIVTEPVGGAHRDWHATFAKTGKAIEKVLDDLVKLKACDLIDKRFERVRGYGVFD